MEGEADPVSVNNGYLIPVQSRGNDNCCFKIPRSVRTTLAIAIVLAVAEAIGMATNMINAAEVEIVIGNYVYTIDEWAWIGWNRLQLWSDYNDNSLTVRDYNYSELCKDSDNCDECIAINWCKMENKGKIWHYGCWSRLVLALFVGILFILMAIRNKNNNNVSYDGYSWREMKRAYFNKNGCLVLLFELFLCLWCACGITSIIIWDTNNPMYNFQSVRWSISFVIVFIEVIITAVLFLWGIVDFCRFK